METLRDHQNVLDYESMAALGLWIEVDVQLPPLPGQSQRRTRRDLQCQIPLSDVEKFIEGEEKRGRTNFWRRTRLVVKAKKPKGRKDKTPHQDPAMFWRRQSISVHMDQKTIDENPNCKVCKKVEDGKKQYVGKV